MGFDDRNTVAVIGGGHAFGKCHGACPADEADADGFCPGGKSWENKFTSGLELEWTSTPTTWSNQYFQSLFDFEWEETTSPAGALQWKPSGDDAPSTLGMLTTDLALNFGDPIYEELSREYASSLDNITRDFGQAWYQLMARDMGPRERCLGDELPPVQDWEVVLEQAAGDKDLPDYVPIRSMIQSAIDDDSDNVGAFAQLAMMCSNTYRQTDYRGGCNGE